MVLILIIFVFALGMKEGLDVLRMLFFANLLSGQRDTSEIIEFERENDEKMDTELVKRRQQRTGDASDNEEGAQNEQQQQSSGDNTAEAATTTRNRPTRASSSDKDEIESPYENALQIKLDLKLNEYRHGQYPFDNFVNEYTNEKIEIKKEYLDFIQRTTNSTQFSFIFYPFFLSTINKIGNFQKFSF
jgi:hypothetical protein